LTKSAGTRNLFLAVAVFNSSGLLITALQPDFYQCEAIVYNHNIISILNGWTVRLFAAFILLLVIQTHAFAGLSRSTDHENYFLAADNGPASEREQYDSAESPSKPVFTTMTSGTLPASSAEAAAGAEKRVSDWRGVWLDTGLIMGAQVGAAAVTYVMPEDFSGWSEEQKKSGFDKYWRNFGEPVWDNDKFYVNYILHPYWGSTYYTRARERGLDQTESFAYSVMMSAMFEYGAECFAEKPSIQDLIVTPVAGSLLGAYVFEPLRNSIKAKEELRWYDHALLVATDPIGLLSLGVEKLFGIKSTITVDYSVAKVHAASAEIGETGISSSVRLSMTF
jgi:hypothetical protein